ncbi:MAG: tRNA (guanosine(37)-N1)-methyltransferase TrmD [Gammaproteobacteria bacterium]
MVEFAVITLFPEMLGAVRDYGVIGRAVKSGSIRIRSWNPRDFAEGVHRAVDDRPYGGGPGMVMMMPPVCAAIRAARDAMSGACKVIHLTPQGRLLDQNGVMELAAQERLIFVAGRYEGLDERIIETEVDEEWSIGDYVLSGGELAAMVLIDTVTRTLPGVLGHEDSAQEDSFGNGLLDYPHYTRPEEFAGRRVPEVLQSGNHEKIRRWRLRQALGRTWLRRPELLETLDLDAEQRALLEEFKTELQSQKT